MEKKLLVDILSQFSDLDINKLNDVYFENICQGHINDTMLVKLDNKKYILQKINTKTFANVEGLMNNIRLVSEYINSLDKHSIILQELIKTQDGKYYLQHQSGVYRLYNYVEGVCYQQIETSEQFYYSGVAFGSFAKELDQFDSTMLVEIIKNFHNTEDRLNKFLKVLSEDKHDRVANAIDEVNFVLNRQSFVSEIIDKLNSGEIPYRVTHNDTKLNNVVLDKNTNHPIAIIDLDTIMPGSLCYDFGDSIRYGCNTAAEDEENLDLVHFDIDLFKAYAEGYLSVTYDIITKSELDNLVKGAWMMTFECGMRFLTDYLDGDNYFKVSKDKHNLFRARTQFKLVSEIEENIEKLNMIIKEVYSKYSNK